MKKILWLCSLSILSVTPLMSSAASVDECYKSAQTTAAVRECLKQELQETREEYRAMIEKLTNQAGELDRVTGRSVALPALEKANISFDRYVSDQCVFDEAMSGSGTGAGAANLSCQINLLRIRMGSLEAHTNQ